MARSYFGLLLSVAVGCGGVVEPDGLLCPAGTTNTVGGCTPVGVRDAGPTPPRDAGTFDSGAPSGVLLVEPGFIDFGGVTVGQTIERTVTVFNPTPGPVVLQVGRRLALPFGSDLGVGAYMLESGERRVIRVTFTPGRSDLFESALVLGCGPECLATIPVVGVGLASPIDCGVIDLGVVPVGQCRSAPMLCHNLTARTVLVSEVSTPSAVPFNILGGGTSTIRPGETDVIGRVEFCPQQSGPSVADLSASVDVESGTVRVRVGQVLGVGDERASPCSIQVQPIDFGPVPVGGVVSRAGIVENRGGVRCEVTVIGLFPLGDPGYRLVMPNPGSSVVLEPGAQFQVFVRFSPPQSGLLTGGIELRTGDPNNPNPVILLSGVGDTSMTASYTMTYTSSITPLSSTLGTSMTWTGSPDDGYAAITIPFNFEFLSIPRTTLYVSTNGFVTFDAVSAGSFANQNLPDGDQPNALFALWWDDLDPGLGGDVRWRVSGTAPSRSLWVEYENIQRFGDSSGGSINMIIALHEIGIVDIFYGTSTSAAVFRATSGWENEIGTRGANAYPCAPMCGAADWPTNTRIRFTPN